MHCLIEGLSAGSEYFLGNFMRDGARREWSLMQPIILRLLTAKAVRDRSLYKET